GRADRRRRVRRSADSQEGERDAVEPVLVASECREERLAEVRHVADDRFETPIGDDLLRGETDADGELRAGLEQQRLAADAGAETGDAVAVDAALIARIGEQYIQCGGARQRANGLHFDVRREMQYGV